MFWKSKTAKFKMKKQAKELKEMLLDNFNSTIIKTENDANEIVTTFLGLGQLLLEIKNKNKEE